MHPIAAAATAAALIALSMATGEFLKNLEVPRAVGAIDRIRPKVAALRGLNAVKNAADDAASVAASRLQPLASKLRGLAGPAVASRLAPLAKLTGLGQTNSEWFKSLKRPFWLLPQPIIGLVWTSLYLAMGGALYRLLVRPSMRVGDRMRALVAWGVQMVFASLWGFPVFALRSPAIATAYSMVYLGLVAAAARVCAAFDRRAGRLMLPMVLWIALSTIPTGLALMFKN
jgi:tryptophan-rich sensory protein